MVFRPTRTIPLLIDEHVATEYKVNFKLICTASSIYGYYSVYPPVILVFQVTGYLFNGLTDLLGWTTPHISHICFV